MCPTCAAQVYRALAVIAAEGVNHLPRYCLAIAGALMGGAVLINLLKDFVVPPAYKKFVPLPSAVSIPFFIGAPIAIDFCMGGAIMLIWCALLHACVMTSLHRARSHRGMGATASLLLNVAG